MLVCTSITKRAFSVSRYSSSAFLMCTLYLIAFWTRTWADLNKSKQTVVAAHNFPYSSVSCRYFWLTRRLNMPRSSPLRSWICQYDAKLSKTRGCKMAKDGENQQSHTCKGECLTFSQNNPTAYHSNDSLAYCAHNKQTACSHAHTHTHTGENWEKKQQEMWAWCSCGVQTVVHRPLFRPEESLGESLDHPLHAQFPDVKQHLHEIWKKGTTTCVMRPIM